MKNKLLIIIILLLTFIPTIVKAEDIDVEILSVEFVEKSDTVIEENPAKIENSILKFDLKFLNVGDYAKYKLVVRNNTDLDLLFDESNLMPEDKSVGYEIEYIGNRLIKSNSETTINLKVIYAHKADNKLFRNSIYDASNDSTLNLSDNFISIPNTLRNIGIIPLMLIMFTIGAIIYGLKIGYTNKKITSLQLLVISFLLLFLPKYADALKLYEIPVQSKIIIEKVKPNPCTFEGELVQGAEFIEGQYTYRYMQQFNGSSWSNIDNDGWGIVLTNRSSTVPVTSTICSTINDKPLVSMSYAFSSAQAPSINLEGVDTSNVTNMSYMFRSSAVKELDLSSFNTSKVTTMNSMFNGAYNLKSLYLRHFDTSNVTYFYNMFDSCTSLVELNLDEWNFDKSNSNYLVFNGVSALKKLSVKYLKNIKKLESWYTGSGLHNSPVEEIDVTGWDLGTNTSLQGTFNSGKLLKKIIGLNTWDTSNITNMYMVFENCEIIEEIDVTGWDISKTENISYFFSYDYNLKRIIGLDTWDTSNVTNMSSMFTSTYMLRNLDLSNFDFSNVANTNYMFSYMYNLVNLKLPKTESNKITNAYGMFYNAYMLRTLDLSNFDFSNVTNSNYFFTNNFGLIELKTPKNVQGSISFVKKLYDDNSTEYSSIPTSNSESITLKADKEAVFKPGSTFNSNIKDICDNYSYGMKHFVRSDELPLITYKYGNTYNIASDPSSEYPIYMWFSAEDDSTVYFYSEIKKLYLNPNTYSMFSYLRNLEDIETKDMDSSRSTTLSYFVKEDNNLKSLDVSHFDTSNVTDFYGAFKYTYALYDLDVSGWDTSKVTTFAEMFTRSGIRKLDMSNWDMSKNQSTYSMITEMSNLQILITPKNINNVSFQLTTSMADENGTYYSSVTKDMDPNLVLRIRTVVYFSVESSAQLSTNYIYYDPIEDKVYGDLPVPTMEGKTFAGWYTTTPGGVLVTKGSKLPLSKYITLYAAWESPGATAINGSYLNTRMKMLASNITDSSSTDYNIYYIKREKDSSKIPENLTYYNIASINGCEYPVYIWYEDHTIYYYTKASKIKITDASYLFRSLSELREINLDDFDFSDCKSFSYMFYYDKKLEKIDLSKIDLSNATDFSNMFSGCSKLISVVFGKQNTTKLTNMYYMFSNAESLISVDIGNLDTTNVTNMKYLFSHCSSLKIIDLTGLETDNVTTFEDMFEYCTKLERVVFGHKNTPKLNNMYCMFYHAESLISVDIGNLDTTNVTNMSYLFCCCYALESIDLTEIETDNVTNFSNMFNGCKKLKTVVFGQQNSTKLTNMYSMFYGAESLISVDIGNLDTTNVTSMSNLFYNCSSLESIDLTGLETDSVTSISYMFYKAGKLKSINFSGHNFSNLTNAYYAFAYMTNLTHFEIDVISSLSSIEGMFYCDSSLEKLDLSNIDFTATSSYNMLSGMTSLKEIKTPNSISGSLTISLGRSMYAQGDSTSINVLKNDTPSGITLKNAVWS